MGALLAGLSSLLWGTGDFVGGTLSRRAHPVAVMRATQGFTAVVLAIAVVATGELGRTGAIGWGVAGGVLGCVGLGSFYAALAAGTMGVVAPIAATGVVIPVAIGLLRGESPQPAQFAGMALAIVGVILASGPERGARAAGRETRRPLVLAGIAALAFGGVLVVVAEGGEESVGMTLLVMRIVNAGIGTALLLTVLRRAPRPTRADLPQLGVVVVTDTGANWTYALAAGMGQLSISAVLASLYPAVTALLAWRIHGERLARVQVVGVVATLVGVALIAAG